MALHNYIYLKHKNHDPSCHKLIARDHDSRPDITPSSTMTLDGRANSNSSINTASGVIQNTDSTSDIKECKQT